MKKQTIWYCHHYAGSPTLGMSYRPYYLTREFCNAGHNAYVISANYHHLLREACPQEDAVTLKDIDGVPFVHLKTPSYQGNGLARIINMLSYAARFKFNLNDIIAVTGRPDVIIVSSSHLFHYPVLEKIAKKYKAKLIVEVRDLWPLSLIELLNVSRFNPLIMWLSRIERRAYRNADHVVSLLDAAFPYMQTKGLDAERFHVIPNGASVALFQSHHDLAADVCRSLSKLHEKGLFLLGYAGALGAPNAMDYLIAAMAIIAEKKLPIQCVIVGEGSFKVQLETSAARLQLQNILFLPAIPKHQIPDFLHKMDALYLGWNAADLYKYGVSPNKLFDYMMAGKPIIESGGAVLSIVNQFKCGIQCAPINAEAIADAIVTMYDMPIAQRRAMGARGKKAVEKFYDYRILAQTYSKLF